MIALTQHDFVTPVSLCSLRRPCRACQVLMYSSMENRKHLFLRESRSCVKWSGHPRAPGGKAEEVAQAGEQGLGPERARSDPVYDTASPK